MISDLHINHEYEPLTPSDSVGFALEKLNGYHLDLLPLVDKQQHLVNYVSAYDIETLDKHTLLADLPLYTPVLPYVTGNEHLLSSLSRLKSQHLSLIAVLDDNGEYQGILRTKDVVKALSQSLTIKSAGSIIVLRVKPIDFSMSDISRIIEYSDAKILGFLTFDVPGSEDIEIHLKLNTNSLKVILATLERYDYRVTQYFNREDLTDDLDTRYENLMKFIDI